MIPLQKRIALIAHDHEKPTLVEWCRDHLEELKKHELCATGTTGGLLAAELGLEVRRYRSGPQGGDQQIGARIAEGTIDMIIFFWDSLQAQPHDVDVKALLRLAVLYNIPVACNRASADFFFSSRLMQSSYENRPDPRLF